MRDFQDEITKNKHRSMLFLFVSFILLALLFSVLSIPVIYFGHRELFVFLTPFILALLTLAFLSMRTTKTTLKIAGGLEVTSEYDPAELINIVAELSVAANIAPAKVWVIESNSLNAFTCGSIEDAHIVYTTGLLNHLNRDQLQGVTAHEISHIVNGDSDLMTLIASVSNLMINARNVGFTTASMMASSDNRSYRSNRKNGNALGGLIGMLAMLLAVLGFITSSIMDIFVSKALSRSREWMADATSVDLTRNPSGLREALEVISKNQILAPSNITNLSYLCIDEPVREEKGVFARFFSKMNWSQTHPSLEERIERLYEIEGLR